MLCHQQARFGDGAGEVAGPDLGQLAGDGQSVLCHGAGARHLRRRAGQGGGGCGQCPFLGAKRSWLALAARVRAAKFHLIHRRSTRRPVAAVSAELGTLGNSIAAVNAKAGTPGNSFGTLASARAGGFGERRCRGYAREHDQRRGSHHRN